MIPFVLKYWKFGLGAVSGALIMYGAMELRVWYLNASHALEIENTKSSLIQQCAEDKKITERVSNEYQDQIADLGRRLADLKRMRQNVPISTSKPTSGRDAGTGAGHADGNGIDTGTLYDYAGQAERYRRQLKACQSFIREVWKEKTPQ